MKKEFSIIIFLFVIVVLTHMFTQKNTRNFLNSIILDLESIEKDIFNNNIEKDNLSEKIDNIYSKWKEQYKYLAYYIEHDELEKLENEMISQGFKPEYFEEVKKLRGSLFADEEDDAKAIKSPSLVAV